MKLLRLQVSVSSFKFQKGFAMLEKKDGILDLVAMGRKTLKMVHRNLPTAVLYERIVRNREGQISHQGPIVVRTGDFMELPLTDKFVVKQEADSRVSEGHQEMSAGQFNNLAYRLSAYLQNKEVYVHYSYVGRDPDCQIPVRVVTETAWHSLFARNMFMPIHGVEDYSQLKAEFSVMHIPGFHAVPDVDDTRSSAAVIFNMEQKIIFICGTSYAGEIRLAVFTFLNYLLPESVFPMRCAANVGPEGDAAIFMGRSGAGKTTLSVDPERRLLGDHFHGWTVRGLFNFERGAYAGLLGISEEDEPEISACSRKFGTILENVSIDMETRRVDLEDRSLTENTRAIYPLTHIPNAAEEGICDHPKHLFLLTCDGMGVMPAIARMTPEMAVYAFMSGYTSRFAETESGTAVSDIGFNTCFGASSLLLPAHVYGNRLLEKIRKHEVTCWLMNTGWIGEPAGRTERIKIPVSRALIRAAVSGKLDTVVYETDPIFGFDIPLTCPGVPYEILNPRNMAGDEGEYEVRANCLAREFMNDFKQFEDQMPESMRTMMAEVFSSDDSFDLLGDVGFSM